MRTSRRASPRLSELRYACDSVVVWNKLNRFNSPASPVTAWRGTCDNRRAILGARCNESFKWKQFLSIQAVLCASESHLDFPVRAGLVLTNADAPITVSTRECSTALLAGDQANLGCRHPVAGDRLSDAVCTYVRTVLPVLLAIVYCDSTRQASSWQSAREHQLGEHAGSSVHF